MSDSLTVAQVAPTGQAAPPSCCACQAIVLGEGQAKAHGREPKEYVVMDQIQLWLALQQSMSTLQIGDSIWGTSMG